MPSMETTEPAAAAPEPTGTTEPWPPDYVAEFARRRRRLGLIRSDPAKLVGAKEYYRTRPARFIAHWGVTYDPRNAGSGAPTHLPLALFRRQRELVEFLEACLAAETNGLVEKCRDVGATWVCAAFSVWLWLFRPGAAVGWGSRKERLVDRLGDPDSIFEKIRMLIMGLPREFRPAGFNPRAHLTAMKAINPETGATITGEAGDNIGRGGRKLIYFKDESAHYERPEKIEAALGDNTRVQIDISSVNGLGNVFHRRREAGIEWTPGAPALPGTTNVFVIDWRDHPAKTQGWYERRRRQAVNDGLLHLFAQEVERDYAAAREGVAIPAEWVRSAVDAHLALGFDDAGGWSAGLDVADGGGDRNALALRKGVILKAALAWGDGDVGASTRRAIGAIIETAGRGTAVETQYDCVGVGASVKAEANRLAAEGLLAPGLKFAPWDAGAAALYPDRPIEAGDKETPLNRDFYANLKAQGWWRLRRRFEKTHRALTEPGVAFPPGELISLPSGLPLLRQIEKELAQATHSQSERLRLTIDKAPAGARSPNLADAIVMAYWPVPRPAGARRMNLSIMGR